VVLDLVDPLSDPAIEAIVTTVRDKWAVAWLGIES
jgi:hypothetical protein